MATPRTVRTATLDIAVIEHGAADGPALVLLHGYPDDPRRYDRVVAELAPDGSRILLPYLRGYGRPGSATPRRRVRASRQRSAPTSAICWRRSTSAA